MKKSLTAEAKRQIGHARNARPGLEATNPVNQGSYGFVDNRAETQVQRRLMADINDSPKVMVQRKEAESLHASPRMAAQRIWYGSISKSAAQLQSAPEDELLQGRFETAQRMEEEEPLQGKFEALQRMAEEEPVQGKFATLPIQLQESTADKPNNTGLPDNLKAGIETLSGISMDSVKVHYNSEKPAQLNALAYAQGTDIHVAPGQEKHLPHEAWHVVQQAQGRVQPTMQMKEGVPINDDQSLEHEADVMGEKALNTSRLVSPVQAKCDQCQEGEQLDIHRSVVQEKVKMSYRPISTVIQSQVIQRACYFFKNADCTGKKVYATSKHNFKDYKTYNCSGDRESDDCVDNDGKGHCSCP